MNEYERNLPGDRERSPEEIQREIELTRERMSQNIDELGEKLSPQNLKRQAREAISDKAHDMVNNVGDQARDTGSRVFDFIRENPLPVAAVGLGAVWLIQQRNRSEISGDRMARFAYTGPERRREGIRGRLADRASHLKESVSGAASSVAERAGNVAERAGELADSARMRASDIGTGARQRIGDLGSRAREQGRRARGGIEHTARDNPLALVAGAAILGLAIGLLVPESERENNLMGSTRDSLVDRARHTAGRVKDAAMEAGQDVREAVREEVELRAPEFKSAIKDVAQTVGTEVKEAAARVKEQATQAAKDRPV